MSDFSGLDDVMTREQTGANEAGNVVSLEEKKQKFTRKPFHYWNVGGREIKLKLKADMIEKVEQKFGNRNILTLVFADDVPSLSIMLTIIQAAAIPFNHGLSYGDVKRLYDSWSDEGGNQEDLLKNVLLPTLVVSGFFTTEMSEEIMKAMEEGTM